MLRLAPRLAGPTALLACLSLLGLAAAAVEPVQITVEGRVEAVSGELAGARDRAVRAAMVEAALRVSRDLLDAPLSSDQEDLLRESLVDRAQALILTYRIEPGAALVPLEGEPGRYEYIVRVTATVDATQLRRELNDLGLLSRAGGRPSVLVRVRSDSGEAPGSDVRLEPLERAVREELRTHNFIVLDPEMLPGPDPQDRSAVELAREAGADVAIDVEVQLRRAGIGRSIVGVIAEARAQATRVQDGFELARVQLDTPAYHTDPGEAAMRALDAVREPLARNLRVQLESNWGVLARDQGALRLGLHGVTRFGQVLAVWELLRGGRGVEGVQLRTLAPGQAEFSLREAPSPGVLQARLAGAELPGFRLEPIRVAADRLEFSVREFSDGEGTRAVPGR